MRPQCVDLDPALGLVEPPAAARLLRSDQEPLAAAIPGSLLVTHEETGHALDWEQPERAAVDLAAFVERAARPSASG
jgi:hypothetical protein